MNTWHYRKNEQEVGPFTWEVLEKLRIAEVIDGGTPIKASDEQDWRPFTEVSNAQNASTPPPPPSPSESSYYYLDANRQPVGPFDLQTLRRLHGEGVISASTLTSAKGESQWISVSQLLGVPPTAIPPDATNAPRHRTFEQFGLMMGVTLTFYSLYLIPSYSRDMKAITGKPRIEFNQMLTLMIVTFILAILLGALSDNETVSALISFVVTLPVNIFIILWAYDLQNHGKLRETNRRQESLGAYVLALTVLAAIIGLFTGGLAIVISIVVAVITLWLLQKEINLYARPCN